MFLITIKKRKLYINSLHFNIIFCNCEKKKATYRYFDAVSSFIFKNRILKIITQLLPNPPILSFLSYQSHSKNSIYQKPFVQLLDQTIDVSL